jgi:uncharacterized protein
MRRRSVSILLAAIAALVASTLPAVANATTASVTTGSALVIGQVYGGGGNSGAPYSHDYVEVFNRGDAAASLTGLSIQYASATGSGNFGSNPIVSLTGTLAPGEYHLVQLASNDVAVGSPLPTPDAVGNINMAGTSGKVALVDGTSGLACNGSAGQPCDAEQRARIVDLVGYGAANFFEGSGAAPQLNNATAAFRAADGCTDTDDNAADFSTGAPAPRNSATPTNPCGGDPVGPIGVISQVYGGGGNAGAPYTHDFVEVFNRGDAPLDLDGLSIQYTSARGTGLFGANANLLVALSGTLAPGQYHLVQLAAGAGSGVPLPTPDGTGTINMSATAGKVVLVDGTSGLGCNGGSTPCSDAQLERIVDLVGFGTSPTAGADFFEGSGAAPTLTNTTAAFRAADGCTDTDDNAADFTAGAPTPRNTSSPANLCGTTGPIDLPVVPTCPALTLDAGQSGSVGVSASDGDGTVVTATIDEPLAGVGIVDLTPADEVGGALTATLAVDGTVAAGSYTVSITFANDDDPPQTGSCELSLTIRPDPCDEPTLISDINTVGANGLPNTTRFGQRLGVEAIVTADFKDGLNGFFVQEEDVDSDGDPMTSEGIFVFAPAEPSAPPVGSLVCVVGTVGVFNGLYQLTNVRVEALAGDQPLPTAVQLEMPVDDLVEIARIAGMRVELTGEDGTMMVVQNFFQGQFGELDLSATGRLWNPTELFRPLDPAAQALRNDNRRAQIKLDDASSATNRQPVPWLANGADRAGAETSDLIEGIAAYQFGWYRIQPTDPDAISFTNTINPRPDGPPDVLAEAERRDQVTVAAFNVLNYFTTLTSESNLARGADTPEEFELQAAKIVTALTKLDADVVGLMEIENNFGASNDALADLVDRLNAVAGPGTYAGVDLGAPAGSDAISNAMIYRPDAVTPVGDLALADHPAFVNPLGAAVDRNRPAVTQAFETASGEVFVAAVNHLKSKGSACGAVDPGNTLAGNCNLTRTMAAEELVRWLAEDDPTGTGAEHITILGDLNAYAMEDPIETLRDNGYVDALADEPGEAYSYVFDGELGRLDHGFVSASLAPHVVDGAEWHINADEPAAFDYNDWNDPATQDTSEFRSSDHDPLVIGLQFGTPLRPSTLADCKDGGWQDFSDPAFRNQGQCVSYIASGRLRGVPAD